MKTEEIVSMSWEVLTSAVEDALNREEYDQAEELALAALEEAEDFDRADRRLSITLECLSEIYYMQGKYCHGAPVCKRLLKLYAETLGGDHMDTAIIEHNLAMLYHSWGKLAQAEPFYKSALKVKTQVLGQRHPEVMTLLGHYTAMLYSMNRGAEAEQLRAKAVQVSNGPFHPIRALGSNHPANVSAGAGLSPTSRISHQGKQLHPISVLVRDSSSRPKSFLAPTKDF